MGIKSVDVSEICPSCNATDSRRFSTTSIYIDRYVCPRCSYMWDVVTDMNCVRISNKGDQNGTNRLE
jgi:transposase-like protein